MPRYKLLDDLRLDARYALRQLHHAPAFTLVAVLTLGLGIGATTAILSAVNAAGLRPLPFHQPDRLVRVYSTSRATTEAEELSPGAARGEGRSEGGTGKLVVTLHTIERYPADR